MPLEYYKSTRPHNKTLLKTKQKNTKVIKVKKNFLRQKSMIDKRIKELRLIKIYFR